MARAASHAAREVASASSAARSAAGARRGPRDARERGVRGWHNGRHCVFPAVATRSVSPAFGARARTFISLPAGSGRLADIAAAAREGMASARAAPIAARDAAARRARAELEKLVGPRVSLTLERSPHFRDGPFRAVEPHAARRPSLQRGARVAVQARRIAGARRAGRRGARRVARRLDGGVARVVGAGDGVVGTRRARLRRGVRARGLERAQAPDARGRGQRARDAAAPRRQTRGAARSAGEPDRRRAGKRARRAGDGRRVAPRFPNGNGKKHRIKNALVPGVGAMDERVTFPIAARARAGWRRRS